MKCPKCGAWNAAYLPKCTQCGAPLPNAPEGPAAWEESLHKKKPSLEITTFDEKDEWSEAKPDAPEKEPGFDPEELDRAQLTDELEDLKKRREDGKKRIRQMRQQADSIRRSIQEAQIVRPIPEADDLSAGYSGDSAAMFRWLQPWLWMLTRPDCVNSRSCGCVSLWGPPMSPAIMKIVAFIWYFCSSGRSSV